MGADPPIADDPVIRRVAAVRPRIDEEELSPTAPHAVAIVERILAGSPEPVPQRFRRPRWSLPWLGLVIAPVAGAIAIVLLLVGTFSGPDHSGTQPADAAVIRATLRALDPSPGTIFVESETYFGDPSVHGHPYTIGDVYETPSGPGAQNALWTTDHPGGENPGHQPLLTAYSYVGGEVEVYSPTTNTIYESSIWGPYLHPGSRAGTYVYRNARGAPFNATKPVTVSAAQRRGLLRGTLALVVDGASMTVKVQAPPRVPSPAAQLREAIAGHVLHVVGPATVGGRPAIKLAGRWGPGLSMAYVYLDPRTHLPFEQIWHPGARNQMIIHMSERKLLVTESNERLLSLHALHPTARIDGNHSDYLRATGGEQFFPG